MTSLTSMFVVLALAAPAHADSVSGFCERDGKRLTFSDGIAFADARDADGMVTTTIFLTAKPLDLADLAKCSECSEPLTENTFGSPRGDRIKAQRSATAAGWIELAHSDGVNGMTSLGNIMYLADDGVLTGIDGGNGRVTVELRDDGRAVGKVTSEARGEGYDETDMTCAISFDVAIGWPHAR